MWKNDNSESINYNDEEDGDVSFSYIETYNIEKITIQETNDTLMLWVAAMTILSQIQNLKIFGNIKNIKVTMHVDSGSFVTLYGEGKCSKEYKYPPGTDVAVADMTEELSKLVGFTRK